MSVSLLVVCSVVFSCEIKVVIPWMHGSEVCFVISCLTTYIFVSFTMVILNISLLILKKIPWNISPSLYWVIIKIIT